MSARRTSERLRAGHVIAALVLAVLIASPALAEEADGTQGKVELLYRSVSIDGSKNKFDEDFDGLESGTRLGHLFMNWLEPNSSSLDFATLELYGLGGEPFESSSLKVGRKGTFNLRLSHRKQSYLYDLFPVSDDEDGQLFNTDNRRTDFDLSIFAGENVEFMVGYDEVRRTGSSLFMKDILRDLFRLETPIDRETRRYSGGVKFSLGPARILFRQTARQYDNQFNNFTEGDEGLALFSVTGDLTTLDSYDWEQNTDGTADLTDIQVLTPIGDRVDLSVSYHGTLFGEEEVEDFVLLNAAGNDYAGAAFTFTNAFSAVEIERDTNMFDVDFGIRIIDPITLHLTYRNLEQEAVGSGVEDLDIGTCTTAGVCNNGPTIVQTQFDYSLDVATALVEWQVVPALQLHGGYRLIDRELIRNGFATTARDMNFESDGDSTALFGFSWRASRYFRFSGDFEDGDVDRPFSEVSFSEVQRVRVRTTFLPVDDLRIGLTYTDFENENEQLARSSRTEGTSGAASVWHKVNDRFDYMVSYTMQEIDTQADILFDTGGFGATETGDTFFDADLTSLMAQFNFKLTDAWTGFARYMMSESDGDNIFIGDGATGLLSSGLVNQDYNDWEAGLTYKLPSGLRIGGSVRGFDYEDTDNPLLDYDGLIFTARAGIAF
jgi:hypothetical protein